MEQSDIKLLKDAKRGNKKAIETLFKNYKEMAFNISYRIVQRYDVAEDIVMDSFIKILQGNFNIQDSFKSYFFKTVVNNSLNYVKKEKRESVSFDEFNYDIVTDETPEKITEREELLSRLKEAINKLPENQKTAFILIKYEDLSYKEASKIMGKSVKSIESLISRAKENILKELSDLKDNI